MPWSPRTGEALLSGSLLCNVLTRTLLAITHILMAKALPAAAAENPDSYSSFMCFNTERRLKYISYHEMQAQYCALLGFVSRALFLKPRCALQA